MTNVLSKEARVIVDTSFQGNKISFESGWIAKQAGGAVIVRQGETMVLVAVCRSDARPDQDFFPLTVEYQEKSYAAGKIPGGFLRREGRPAEQEVLSARLIDRPIRPLFPEGYMDEIQVICTVLSADGINSPDVLAICGASAALHISDIPFLGPVAGVRVGRVNGKLLANPSYADLELSDVDFVVVGSKEAIVMVEGGAAGLPESEVLEALFFGHQALQELLSAQEDLRHRVGKEKLTFVPPAKNETLVARVHELTSGRLEEALHIVTKQERQVALHDLRAKIVEELSAEFPEMERQIKHEIHERMSELVRGRILREKTRIDNRGLSEVRPIECELGIIPRAHGSALFTRGETQALVTTTLGSGMDAQRIDALTGQTEKVFMLHYNFPPYSTGEVKNLRGTGRREVGHGALAERALKNILPSNGDFPYVLRIVSEITESNGSSSMATVCGGTLSMMDAGIKIKNPVAGVAMGLIKEGDQVAVLTDILGDEDHLGDMDFKVCGTRDGVTALQMDIKCSGLNREIMGRALEQARTARLHILEVMLKTLAAPRESMSPYAPTMEVLKINPDKIRDVIGPGGKMIRSITEETGAKIDIEDDGTVKVFACDREASNRAMEIIKGLTEEAEIGKVYSGMVKRITDFGAFVEILPGVDGLLHVSQIASNKRIQDVSDVMCEGDEVTVKVLDIDRQGRVRLSQKALQED